MADCQPAEFIVKRWLVSVAGYSATAYTAKTRGSALADAWRCGAFDGIKFGEFLKIARCRRDRVCPSRWGDKITVSGKPAFFLGNNPQYIQFVWPGSDVVLNSHPYDVLPVGYRPSTYRDRDDDARSALPKDQANAD
jgi:hypothetical protein